MLQKLKELLYEKDAIDPVILDMSDTNMLTDYFFILTGNSKVHMTSLRDALADYTGDLGLKLIYADKGEAGDWVLVDAGEVVFHIFSRQGREFYALEDLWKEAERINI